VINWANLRKRLAFAGAAIPVAFFIVTSPFSVSGFALKLLGMEADAVGPVYPGQLLSLAIVLLGAHEYMKMLSAANKVNAFWLGPLWIFLTGAADLYLGHPLPATLFNVPLLIIAAFEAFFFGKEAMFGRWKRVSLFFCGTIVLSIAAAGLISLYREYPVQKLFNGQTFWIFAYMDTVAIITATFMCDTAAYFVGSTIGKRHFSAISPNKTVEGSAAGLIAATAVMWAAWPFIKAPDCPMYLGPALGALIGVTAQAGDLLASLIKRYFNVKDASHIIPGHGGVLDRFDSLFFTAPVIYMFAWLVGKWMG
jgi:phosphatidate cytidylyltransferase